MPLIKPKAMLGVGMSKKKHVKGVNTVESVQVTIRVIISAISILKLTL